MLFQRGRADIVRVIADVGDAIVSVRGFLSVDGVDHCLGDVDNVFETFSRWTGVNCLVGK